MSMLIQTLTEAKC